MSCLHGLPSAHLLFLAFTKRSIIIGLDLDPKITELAIAIYVYRYLVIQVIKLGFIIIIIPKKWADL